ncbi:MAG TPA: ATP-binding protein [Vicinamibacterales bacterium]|nr:ATP-binding protein [Vicinamibacterales bacterium]
MTFRTRLFVASLLASAVTLSVAAALVSWSVYRIVDARIERGLVDEARLAAETLSHRQAATAAELDAEADALGRLIAARVTFVGRDGTVVGDSEVTTEDLATLENHGTRPEILQARREGVGIARRYSATLKTEMLYVAVEVPGSATPLLSEVRLAMPLTEISEQLAGVRHSWLAALAVGLLAALVVAWGASSLLSRRVRAIADMAERYATGDLTPSRTDFGTDEIGTVARMLDDSIREIGNRVTQRETDRARMEAILDGMSEGVLVVTPQGRLQFVNNAARRMLKVEDAPEGHHYLEIARHPDIAGEINAALHGLSGDGRELTLGGDRTTTFIARGAPVASVAGRGAVLVLHDITELRKADRIRRDFVANVSHELRTPLTAVRGYVEALLDGVSDASDTRRFLETIARHTFRMERLVRDLLRLARLDAGQEPLDRAECAIDSLFHAVVSDVSSELEARSQRVVERVDPDATVVSGDPAKLHDALRNLLHNATSYAPERSEIVLTSSRKDNRIVLTVADSGPGIPEADLPRVFERFYRVDKARSRSTRDPGGTGLGLAIVKHLVGLHGGKVAVANRPVGGAIFTIELPG